MNKVEYVDNNIDICNKIISLNERLGKITDELIEIRKEMLDLTVYLLSENKRIIDSVNEVGNINYISAKELEDIVNDKTAIPTKCESCKHRSDYMNYCRACFEDTSDNLKNLWKV